MASPTILKNALSKWSEIFNGTLVSTAILFGLALIGLCQLVAAQDYSQGVGAPTYTSAEPVELGFVNASNGNLHMEIPMASFPQRAGKPLTFKLVYDSRIWYLNSGTTWDPNSTAQPWGGWRFINPAGLGSVNFTVWSSQFCNVNGHQTQDQGNNNFSWQAPDGTTHYFNITLQFSNNCGGQVAFCGSSSAVDGSGYFMVQNDQASCQGRWPLGTTVLGPDGAQIYTGCTSCNKNNRYYDTNGNYFSSDSNGNTIDTLGRTPVIVTSNCGTNQTCYDVLNSQGASARSRWTVTTESISVHTAFGDPAGLDYQGTLTVIQSITLPDGSSYTFTYDSGTTAGHYGEVTGITLPDGGQVSYNYTVYKDALGGYNHWATKHISGGGTTTYVLGNIGTPSGTQTMTVTKPSGDYKQYTFTLNIGLATFGAWKNQVTFNSSGGSLLETIVNTWTTTPYGVRSGGETVTMQTPGGSISKQMTFAYNNTFTPYKGTVKEWNYYTGSPSSTPDRITTITYLSDTNSSYAPSTGVNILGLATSVVVADGNSNPLKQTKYNYDASSLASMPNVSQHDDTNYGTGITTRGNRTLAQQWTVGSTYLTVATMTYDMTGQMVTSKDAKSNLTSYGYSDCYLTGNPPTTYTPSQATNAYLTTVTLPISGNTTACYYYNTGKTAWTKDQNSAQTSYFFVANGSNDPLDRLTSKTLPTGGWVLNTFSLPATTVDTYTSIQTTSPSATCTSCRHDQLLFDGLARPIDQILVNDPDGQTTVRTDYDANGRVLDTSHPYRSTGDSTYGFETNFYDGMDRVIQVSHQDGTSRHTYYGAAVSTAGGQSTQLCPAGTCHLGYPTLLKDESGKIRQVWTDGFGNLVEVDETSTVTVAAAPGTGTVTIGGSEHSYAAAAGSTSISISIGPANCVLVNPNPPTYAPQQATVNVTINGLGASATWGGSCNGSTETIMPSVTQFVTNLASTINGLGNVTATINGSTITIRAKTTGANTNYPISITETYGFSTSQAGTGYTVCPGAAASCNWLLSGGTNGGPDTGIVSLTVGGFGASYTWGATDSASSVASNLATQLSSSSSPVSASANGGVITVTAKSSGSQSNYSVSASVRDTAGFAPSFTVTAPSSLTGGTDAGPGAPTVTYYLYDLLGNLTQATVVGSSECNRTYLYDSFSRMTQSKEPEVGNGTCTSSAHTVTYAYTTSVGGQCSGNPSLQCSRTDGRGTTTTYSYDALNRSTGRTFSDGNPAVVYSYDQTTYNGLTIANGSGRRTGMSDAGGLTAWSYDANGNIVTEKRTIAGNTKTTSYAYNLDNSLKKLTYPSGRIVNLTIGNAERATSVIDGNGTQYVLAPASGWQYEPMGNLAKAIYGKSGTFGGITEARTYNNRLELTGISATSSAGTIFNVGPGYNSNGEIASISNSLDSGRTQNFLYDALSRITKGSSQATSGTDCWGQTFTIDNVGNLTNMAVSQCSGGSLSAAVNQNNQFSTGYTYDAAGNLTNDGIYTYGYNAENEITSANGVTYTYDGNRMRVKKSGTITLYRRDLAGNTIAETSSTGADVNEYVFFAGRRLARIDPSGNVYYYLADQIGSTRVIASSSGTLCYDADFTPYGSEMAHTSTCAQNYKFAGYERDSETGLDYAMNRYYNLRIGRFMSADPSGIASATLSNPQSLHRYSYVLNNPLIGIDPLGLECVLIGNGVQAVVPTVEDANPGENTNDWSAGTDSAGCLDAGGLYFSGNNEVNFDNYAQDGGDWGRFDIDPDSNWVGLTNDNGVPMQAACAGSDCTLDQLDAMGSGYNESFYGTYYVQLQPGQGDHVTFLDYKLNKMSCDFMSAGVSAGEKAAGTGGGTATAGTLSKIKPLGEFGGVLTAVGSVYAGLMKTMSYLGGCSAYGQ